MCTCLRADACLHFSVLGGLAWSYNNAVGTLEFTKLFSRVAASFLLVQQCMKVPISESCQWLPSSIGTVLMSV